MSLSTYSCYSVYHLIRWWMTMVRVIRYCRSSLVALSGKHGLPGIAWSTSVLRCIRVERFTPLVQLRQTTSARLNMMCYAQCSLVALCGAAPSTRNNLEHFSLEAYKGGARHIFGFSCYPTWVNSKNIDRVKSKSKSNAYAQFDTNGLAFF